MKRILITGLGLLTMRERVELVKGTLAVESAQPQGTTIRATVPLKVTATGAAALLAAPVRPARVRVRPARSASADQDSESRE